MDIEEIRRSNELMAKVKQGWVGAMFHPRDPEAAKSTYQRYLDEQAAIKTRYAPELWAAAEAANDLIDYGYEGGDTSTNECIAIIADAMEAWRSNPTV